ncbi:MAG: N-acetylmuramoyl-L-alanine amidase [Candidatus Muirbacterium halophilum]|nr:N-acetylmuramoyl-L-alanine amidase [Candidatus Muirbacterium halophilum]MCK9476942.1 N-acetylmuramoyl-L-alanine amidase [Candidatus Muirbacterium halophilum]
MFKKFIKLLIALFVFSIIIFFFSKLTNISVHDEIIICIDPGHGGLPEYGNKDGGDNWYEPKKTFLNYYNYGGIFENIKEHEYVYELAILIKKYVEDLNTITGYEEMRDFLKKHNIFLNSEKKKNFKVFLSRDNSAEVLNLTEKNVNRFYRTFDSPHKDKIFKGKLSRINSIKPHFTLSLHLNFVESEDYRGMLSFFAPSIETFDYIIKNKENRDILIENEFYSKWNVRSRSYAVEGFMINDANTYFTGLKNDGRFIGRRNEMLTWKYDEEKLFKDREESINEKMRRSGGYEGLGGDNLYFSNEILRYVSYFLNVEQNIDYNILEERASDFSVCIFNNSITAALELGNIYSTHDRKILLENKENIAKYIAYGIFCVNTGIHKIEEESEKIMPYGKRIDLEKYGDYFKESVK